MSYNNSNNTYNTNNITKTNNIYNTNVGTNPRYVFWLDDPQILFTNGNYSKIIPTVSMTKIEQLNAVTRLSIYFIIFCLLFGLGATWICLALSLIIFIIILYNIYVSDPNGKYKELVNEREIYNEDFSIENEIANYNKEPDYSIESGQYDSNGELVLGKEYDIYTNVDKDLLYTLDELIDYEQATCKRPTADNPYMNPTLKEYDTFNPPAACNADDDQIKELAAEQFNQNLYMNWDDLYDLKNSQRQFYTIPMPAIPNDQEGLANWCYKTELTCKEDQEQCLRNEHLRFKRHL